MKANPSLPLASVTILPTAAPAPVKQRHRRNLPSPVVDARERFLERVRSTLDDRRGISLPPDPAPLDAAGIKAHIRRVDLYLELAHQYVAELVATAALGLDDPRPSA